MSWGDEGGAVDICLSRAINSDTCLFASVLTNLKHFSRRSFFEVKFTVIYRVLSFLEVCELSSTALSALRQSASLLF
jgi:hypothetical protein